MYRSPGLGPQGAAWVVPLTSSVDRKPHLVKVQSGRVPFSRFHRLHFWGLRPKLSSPVRLRSLGLQIQLSTPQAAQNPLEVATVEQRAHPAHPVHPAMGMGLRVMVVLGMVGLAALVAMVVTTKSRRNKT